MSEEIKGEPVAWMFKVWDGRRLNEFAAIDYEPQDNDVYGWELIKDKQPLYTSAIPEGYVLVPVEPTPEMLDGLENGMSYDDCNNSEFDAMSAYKAMIAAAPKGETA